MALVLADRVRDTTTTTGTGTVTLSGTAPTGYQTFGATIGNGNTTYYTINAGSQWEVGIGTYSSTGPTLARTTVLASSNGGSLVDFSTGTKDVFVTYPAEKSVNYDASDNVGIGTTSPGVLLDVFSTAGPIIKNRSSTVNTTLRGFEIQTVNDIHASFKAEPSSGELRIASGFSTWGGYQTFYTNGSERMRITDSGNVGIGTSAPIAGGFLTVGSGAGSSTAVQYLNAGSGGSALLGRISGSNTWFLGDTTAALGSGTGLINFVYGANPWIVYLNNAERMRIDPSGNVGIGTSSVTPVFGRTVKIYNAGSGGTLEAGGATVNARFFGSEGAGIAGVGTTTNTAFNFITNDAERMRITDAGNVGIGTSSPAARLTVSLAAGSVAGGQLIVKDPNYSGVALVQGGSGEGYLWNTSNNFLSIATNNTERMRIDSSGNVGIGNTIPGAYGGRLTVGDPANAFSNNVLLLTQYATATLVADGVTAANGAQLDVSWASGGQGPLRFTFSSTERMRLTSAGALLIGTTTTLAAGFKQHIQLDSGQGGTIYRNSIDGSYALQFLNAAGSTSGWIQVNTSSTTYNSISDVRLKHDIVDAPEASSLIDAIQVRSFKWNADNSEQRYGFVAQELVTVAPEAVSQPADPDDMMGVDYSKLVPMLVKEIQSLRARVAELEGN
jgi:hypothetical protein